MPNLLLPTRRLTPFRSALLTVSGNEITDAMRLAGLQGDGLTYPDGTFGVWGAATNRNINGNATTNTTGVTDAGATTTRVTTGTHKFGAAHFNSVTANAAANEGAYEAISGGLAATQYTVSVWAWAAAGSPTVRIALYDDVSGKQASAAVTLTTTPQRISKTATTGVASTVWRTYVETDVQQNVTFQWGGLQAETGSIASPYVETDGGTATRAAGRVQVPVAGIADSTQGGIALRLRMGYPSTGIPAAGPRAQLAISGADLSIGFTAGVIRARNDATGGVGAQSATQAASWATGATLTAIAYWDATTINVSGNGVAITSVARTEVPTLATLIDLGGTGTVILNDDLFWWALWQGTLSNFDAAVLGALPNIVRQESFPASAGLTAYGNGGEFPAYWRV